MDSKCYFGAVYMFMLFFAILMMLRQNNLRNNCCFNYLLKPISNNK